MSFLESLMIALFTVSVVFVVLLSLYIIMVLFSVIFSSIEKAKTANSAGNATHS